MTETDIVAALRAHLEGTPDRPAQIVSEVDPERIEKPYWLAYIDPDPPERPGVENWHVHRGRFFVSVMFKEKAKEAEARASAEVVAARFPADLPLDAGDGTIEIFSTPHIGRPYIDGANLRVNVAIRYRAQT